MFYGCQTLQKINLNNCWTPKLVDCSEMFYNCNCLQELRIRNLDTTNVQSFNSWNMFYNCPKLRIIKASEKFTVEIKI